MIAHVATLLHLKKFMRICLRMLRTSNYCIFQINKNKQSYETSSHWSMWIEMCSPGPTEMKRNFATDLNFF